ncbi:hypothetical protein BDK51DRAFT_51650 [Blyttiomyces helicus]|uniref:Uncharacterized protein n=1 Tax=Blyttiomyces helicus TaxID=388810 RepID=A0A4P9WEF5_9FUNG|nr:hypothetical protein BDK51DRAFT_51650 [Blyttiomyces helicus]|eukprot:RKO91101.1 hypothetical protein BDK51DRAFT_51650 [Blyttiomyces helicus]
MRRLQRDFLPVLSAFPLVSVERSKGKPLEATKCTPPPCHKPRPRSPPCNTTPSSPSSLSLPTKPHHAASPVWHAPAAVSAPSLARKSFGANAFCSDPPIAYVHNRSLSRGIHPSAPADVIARSLHERYKESHLALKCAEGGSLATGTKALVEMVGEDGGHMLLRSKGVLSDVRSWLAPHTRRLTAGRNIPLLCTSNIARTICRNLRFSIPSAPSVADGLSNVAKLRLFAVVCAIFNAGKGMIVIVFV